MTNYEFIAPCHFGLEAVLKKELTNLGYTITKVEDGKVTDEKKWIYLTAFIFFVIF